MCSGLASGFVHRNHSQQSLELYGVQVIDLGSTSQVQGFFFLPFYLSYFIICQENMAIKIAMLSLGPTPSFFPNTFIFKTSSIFLLVSETLLIAYKYVLETQSSSCICCLRSSAEFQNCPQNLFVVCVSFTDYPIQSFPHGFEMALTWLCSF